MNCEYCSKKMYNYNKYCSKKCRIKGTVRAKGFRVVDDKKLAKRFA